DAHKHIIAIFRDVTADVGDGSPVMSDLTLTPNPAPGRFRLDFQIARPGAVRLAVYDVLGREVAVVARGPWPAGRSTAVLGNPGGPRLAPGLYLVRLSADRTVTRRIVVM